MVAKPAVSPPRSRPLLALILLTGAGVAVAIGVYARVHSPAARPLFLLGFSGMLQLKAWLASAALLLVVVQLLTALWIWGHLPGRTWSKALIALVLVVAVVALLLFVVFPWAEPHLPFNDVTVD